MNNEDTLMSETPQQLPASPSTLSSSSPNALVGDPAAPQEQSTTLPNEAIGFPPKARGNCAQAALADEAATQPEPSANNRPATESGFAAFDGTRLFYRHWQPSLAQMQADQARRAIVFIHRGHEHSGRVQMLVERMCEPTDAAFAWDARGHGYSPGERGGAPDFKTMVADLEAFVQHIRREHQIHTENMVVVANSVGAVIAATWLHDYAPRVRGVVMAAAAFEINLYVPLALPALRFASKFNSNLFVTSYIRPGMLTHSEAQARSYAGDPLITKNISARVLIDLADTAKRVVSDAESIDTPILMLVADQDYVVKAAPQKRFFIKLASPLKRMVELQDCRHAIFYEGDAVLDQALAASKSFIDECFALAIKDSSAYVANDRNSHSARTLLAIQHGQLGTAFQRVFYRAQKLLLASLGRLSAGMRIGMRTGFDSGESLDYIYKNQANGALLLGQFIDRGYLDAIGWRGIRLRKLQLQTALTQLITEALQPAATSPTLRILDVAAGGGRYVLETAKRFQGKNIAITLRDLDQKNLDQAAKLAAELQLTHRINYECQDAFVACEANPAGELPEEKYDIAIVSGLYELFGDNAPVVKSLALIAESLKPGGKLIYTGQPWHPQLLLIAETLVDHRGKAWQMRPRPQAELDGLLRCAGFEKLSTQIGLEGIFTVSVAQLGNAQAPI